MSSYCTRFVVLASLVCLAMPPAFAKPNPAVRRAIQGLYNSRNAAAAHKNLQGGLAHLDPDFHLYFMNGDMVDYGQMSALAAGSYRMTKNMSIDSTIQSCDVVGDGATVTVKDRSTSRIVNPKSHKAIKLVNVSTIRDFWMKTPSGWRLHQSRVISQSQTMNGRPMRAP